jgi:hypothetical protein
MNAAVQDISNRAMVLNGAPNGKHTMGHLAGCQQAKIEDNTRSARVSA